MLHDAGDRFAAVLNEVWLNPITVCTEVLRTFLPKELDRASGTGRKSAQTVCENNQHCTRSLEQAIVQHLHLGGLGDRQQGLPRFSN